MRSSRWLSTVDTHTEGEPTRILTSGIAPLSGADVSEKMAWFRARLDDVRTTLLLEPRGHRDMYGCVLTQPSREEADIGLFFMDNSGYMEMCGHGTIGVATALVELGMVPVRRPTTTIVMETPAGMVEARVAVGDVRADSVSFRNVPAYVDGLDVELAVPGIGDVNVDIAYGGNQFVFVSEAELGGLELSLRNARALVDWGMRVLDSARQNLELRHPVNIATIVGEPENPENSYRNVHVFANRQFDRSPGGTGTSARMAVLHERGRLGVGEEVRVESVTGGVFRGRLLDRVEIGGRSAFVPEITGTAYVTGFHHFVQDPDDRLRHGIGDRP